MTYPPDRVLVLDDEPVIHDLVREVLDEYEVLSAYTVAEARAAVVSGEHFDVALVDKNLPDGSGIDFVRFLRGERPDGEVVMCTAYPSMDSALQAMTLGATDYIVKPMRDITELRLRIGNAYAKVHARRAQDTLLRQLRESEERYRELFDASPDAVLVLDATTRQIRGANPAAERLYGRSRAQLLGTPHHSLVAAEPRPALVGATVVRHDLRADGSTIPVEVSIGNTSASATPQVIEVIRDVSERARAEAERAELERRLARSERLDSLGRLSAGIAHDVNNLLCVIRSNNDLAMETLEADHIARADLSQVEAAVVSVSDLTRRLLAFSGKQRIEERTLDANAVIRGVAKMVGRTLPASVKLDLALAAQPLWVHMDESQLEQVITNLVVNARDAMPMGGVIVISTAQRGKELDLRVRDTGVGIPPELVKRIFEPFFTTKGNAGTGLGLATVHEIVMRRGGVIDVASTPGAGTELAISIPLVAGELVAARQATVPPPIVAGRGESILVVEDNAAVLEATRRLLAGAGYAVHTAMSAEEALVVASTQRKPRLMLTDIDLPGLSGVELAQKLAMERSDIRIVLTSGVAAAPRADFGLPFLAKPYSTEDLLRTVRRTLDT